MSEASPKRPDEEQIANKEQNWGAIGAMANLSPFALLNQIAANS
jgi:hypothetical protein